MEEFKKWLAKAEDDLNWSKHSLDDRIYYGACFAAQQAAEKGLKSYLLKNKRLLRKTHDLVALLEDCIDIDSSFEDLRKFTKILFFYYLETRYPNISDSEDINQKEAVEAYDSAVYIIDFVKSKS